MCICIHINDRVLVLVFESSRTVQRVAWPLMPAAMALVEITTLQSVFLVEIGTDTTTVTLVCV